MSIERAKQFSFMLAKLLSLSLALHLVVFYFSLGLFLLIVWGAGLFFGCVYHAFVLDGNTPSTGRSSPGRGCLCRLYRSRVEQFHGTGISAIV